MSEQTSPHKKHFIPFFTEHIYIMQAKILSDITNNVFIRDFNNFIYSPVNKVPL